MPDLCELDDLKSWLGITDDAQDAIYQRLISATSSDFLSRIRRPGLTPSATHIETVEIAEWNERWTDIYLRHYPINTVASVETLDGLEIPEWDALDPGTPGWIFDENLDPENRQKISLRGVRQLGCWSRHSLVGRASAAQLVVTYDAGYAANAVPAEIAQAIIEWVSFKKGLKDLQNADQTTQWIQLGQYQQNTTIAGSTLKASAMDMPESVARVIATYERPII